METHNTQRSRADTTLLLHRSRCVLRSAAFSTARTDKESYILFYTLRGAGLIEQDGTHVTLSTGQALLLNCRTPQSYCTAPGQSCWHHYWVHLDGAGVAAMEPLLLPGKN